MRAVQAQVKAIEEGKDAKGIDGAIFDAVKLSVETAYRLLKARLVRQKEAANPSFANSGLGALDSSGMSTQGVYGDFIGFDAEVSSIALSFWCLTWTPVLTCFHHRQMQEDPMQLPLPNLNSWLFNGWEENSSWM